MASKPTKKTAAGGRLSSGTLRDTTNLSTSFGGADAKKTRLTIWPEWNDADINAEKWNPYENSKKDDRKTAKSPVQPTHQTFDDPEGKVELPASLKVDSWKRPLEFVRDKMPVVVDVDNILNGFDLISPNHHLYDSEFVRHCISQIIALWEMSATPFLGAITTDVIANGGDPKHSWCPWDHIYSLCKVVKGPHLPLYNPYGKYVVRLYWMGSWRKIYVDDTIPFDSQGLMLLPSSAIQHELWPMLLIKALMKIASLDYAGGNPTQEFGDVSVMQCLTGWIPEAIPLQPSHEKEVWQLIQTNLPEWKLPLQQWEKPPENPENSNKEELLVNEDNPEPVVTKDVKSKGRDRKENKEKDKGGSGKDDKKDKKEKATKGKDKHTEEKLMLQEDIFLPEKPEVVLFATYNSTFKYPVKVSCLGEMADASENLRQNGLSHLYPHPVQITMTRVCPLEPPPPPVTLPAWKLIRPRKKKGPPHDEPVFVPVEPEPIQCVEIASPFINYNVSSVPLPVDTNRPKSSLSRGGTKSRAEDQVISESDENPPPFPPEAAEVKTNVPIYVPEISKIETESKPNSAFKNKHHRNPESAVEKSGDRKVKEPGKLEAARFSESGGLAPPVRATSSATSDFEPVADSSPMKQGDSLSMRSNVAWMDYSVFMKCFRTLYVFHKPNTYQYSQRVSDLKSLLLSSSSSNLTTKADKKTTQTPAASSEGSSPFYLFIDSLVPAEIVVSFSVVPRWFEPAIVFPEERDRKSSLHTRQSKEKEVEKESVTQMSEDKNEPAPAMPGTLIAEPYSWKSLVTGHPALRLRTTGSKSTVLSLAAGRHIFRFNVTSPLGHHVHMCSTVNFLLGDEDTIMPNLTKESLCFRDHATQLINNMGKCILLFSDANLFNPAWLDFIRSHCPYLEDKQLSKNHHFQIFNEALYHVLRRSLKDIINPDIAFAWRAFTFDVTTPNILAIPVGSRPERYSREAFVINKSNARAISSLRSSATAANRSSGRNSLKKQSIFEGATDELEQSDHNLGSRLPSVTQMVSAVKIQKAWRGFYVRKVLEARTPGTEENLRATENLQKCWTLLEPNMEELGLRLLREMFRQDPDIMPHYPFYKDEWCKISYIDYKGVYSDSTPNNWFVIFRDIFFVRDEMLVVPTIQVPVSTCILHVVNNDTLKEVPRVFNRVAPHVYKRNRRGYTFVTEARSLESPVMSNSWQMRLVGSLHNLPVTRSGDVCSQFGTKEIRDYYVPNAKNIIFRQSVSVKEDHLVSLQTNVSKRGVYIKLAVLDDEEEVVSAVGKGHVVIPAFIFHKNLTQEDIETKRSSSRNSSSPRYNEVHEEAEDSEDENANKNTTPGLPGKGEKAPPKSKKESVRNESTGSYTLEQYMKMFQDEELLDLDERVHKYIIQATVLHNSWPLSESSWRFIESLKELEKNEQKVMIQDRSPSPQKVEKIPSTTSTTKSKLVKATKEKVSKEKIPGPENTKEKVSKEKIPGSESKVNQGSHPTSNHFDFSKPHWTLRVVSNASSVENIEVKKDTERLEEIKAMKKAWEDAQPGRAAKALQSRLKFLASHTVKLAPSEELLEPSKEESLVKVDKVESAKKVESVSSVSEAGTESGLTSEQESLTIHHSLPVPTSVFFNESETGLTLEPPPSLKPKEIIEPVDITPFIKKTMPEPLYVDDQLIQSLMEKRQKEIAEFRIFREEVEKWRAAERQKRNLTKMHQLEQYQALQTALDEARDRVNIPREAIRQKFLEMERQKLEEQMNREAALKAEQEANLPKGKKKSLSPGAQKKKK